MTKKSSSSKKKTRVKIRRSWKIRPATRVEDVRVKYNRQRAKKELLDEQTLSQE